MTITTLLNAVTVGATETKGSNITQLTLQSGTTGIALQAALTYSGASESSRLQICMARCADNLPLTLATVDSLRDSATILEMQQKRGSAVLYDFLDIDTVRGGYVYLWTDEPKLVDPATLTVKSIEI